MTDVGQDKSVINSLLKRTEKRGKSDKNKKKKVVTPRESLASAFKNKLLGLCVCLQDQILRQS